MPTAYDGFEELDFEDRAAYNSDFLNDMDDEEGEFPDTPEDIIIEDTGSDE
jgi:hypothetical protein